MKLSKALKDGFQSWIEKAARHGKDKKPYKQSTIDLYLRQLKRLSDFLDDCEVDEITQAKLEEFLVFLQSDELEARKDKKAGGVSGSTLQKHWLAMHLFFDWAMGEFRLKKRPDAGLLMPPSNSRGIVPFTESEIQAILDAIKRQAYVQPGNRRSFLVHRPTESRDLALVMLMLDTGLLAGTICGLRIGDFRDAEMAIRFASQRYPDNSDGYSEQEVPLSKETVWLIRKYLDTRMDLRVEQKREKKQEYPLFLSITGDSMTQNGVRCLLRDLGVAAGVRDVTPYRFRHTFAVEYLRNGGDPFNLRIILGLKTMETILKYKEIAQVDLHSAHQRVSPVAVLMGQNRDINNSSRRSALNNVLSQSTD